jgi:PKD repeat protein
VDEIAITGDAVVPVINVTSPSGGETWEQGSTHDITWTASNTLPNIMIELTTDASGGSPTWTTLVSSIPASQGSWTWNISPTQPTSSDCQIRITDMAADVSGLSGIFSIIEPIYIPDIVINEIMYNPPETGTDSLEYIELYNNDAQTIDLEGYYFSNGVTFTFPVHSLAPGEYVMVASDSVAFNNFFGMTAYQFSGGLSNGGELVLLRHPMGATVDSVEYDDASPWPTEPDGTGPSLVICDPNADNSLGENWTFSMIYQGMNTDGDSVFGSPGMLNCMTAPDPDFTADNTSITTGGSVNFTDLSTGNPTTWEWTFQGGDPTYFSGQNPPPITYNTPGTYSVSLFVSNAAGSDTETKDDYIIVGDFPTAEFEASEDTIQVGESIDFTDLSLGSPTSWEWTFEGGTPGTSTDQNPTGIMYETPGFYNVTLYVVNSVGDDSLVKEEYIKVGYAPVADFEASKDTVYEGETVDFTDLSQNDPDTWLWTFDGGLPATSTEQNPAGIVYETEGTYDVTLRAENMFGFSEEVKVGFIVVVDPVGLEELLSRSMRVYPNPNNGIFNIEHDLEGKVRIGIYDMLGSEVYSSETFDKVTNYKMDELENGIYFIKLTGIENNSTAVGKVIIY